MSAKTTYQTPHGGEEYEAVAEGYKPERTVRLVIVSPTAEVPVTSAKG